MRTPSGNGQSPRFNPFNDDLSSSTEVDDDTLAPSTASEITSTGSDGSGDISLAELGLTEDYFALPEGSFGMSSAEELEAAIENCKRMILEAREHSERKKKLINKLIQLRMNLQELKEGPSEVEPKVKLVLGHKLRKKTSNSVKYYCDCCNGLIWGMLQPWYRCKECGFNCHYKCANNIRRKCIAVDLKNKHYNLDITPEIGLSAQQFNCVECKNPISINGVGKEEARLCDYSGQYYCPQCHWNDTDVIPARVLHNWDFTPQKVSRQSHQILLKMYKKPLLNVQEINPLLFNYVQELGDIRKLRQDILLMKEYFVTCNSALESKLLLKLSSRQHFVDRSDMYSLEDLVLAQERILSDDLTKIHAEYAKHIKLDCLSCQARGFICETCKAGEALFPFDFGVSTCSKCKAVFHRDCFTFSDCPRCKRLQKKKERKSEIIAGKLSECDDDSDSCLDYVQESNNSHGSPFTAKNVEPSPEFTPAFSTENKQNLVRERSPTIEIDNSQKKRHDSSLHNLLTESSYTDYAVLGFTGAGKGRPSVPNLNQCLDGPLLVSKEVEKMPSEEPKDIVPKVSRDESDFQQKPRSCIRFHHSQEQQERYESNPITRQRQREEVLFGELIRVRNPNKEERSGQPRQIVEESHARHLGNGHGITDHQLSRTSKSHFSKVDISDPFNQNETKGSKFVAEAARTNSGQSGSSTPEPPFDSSNHNRTPESRLATGHGKHRATKTKQSTPYGADFDPFGQHRRKGSKFIDEITRVQTKSSSTNVAISSTYNPTLDPFSSNQSSRPSQQSPTTVETYSPRMDPFNQNWSTGSKFIREFETRRTKAAYHGQGTWGDTFEEEGSGNPFEEEEYDSTKNPFS